MLSHLAAWRTASKFCFLTLAASNTEQVWKNGTGHESWRVIAAILVGCETHFTIFVYRLFEIEILGIVVRREYSL